MSLFPKWMIALAGTNLVAMFLCPFYLFGGLHPLGTTDYAVVNFLLYLLTNMIWLVPVWLFFVSLDRYRRGYERTGIAIALLGIALTATGFILLL